MTKEDMTDVHGEGEQEKKDAMNQARWRVGVGELLAKWGKSGDPHL